MSNAILPILAGAAAFTGTMFALRGKGERAAANPSETPEDLEVHYEIERATGTMEHTVSSPRSPRAQVVGIPTTSEIDAPGWKGVFVGDADDWIPVMVRDGYWNDQCWVYEIDFDALAAAGRDYWITEDPNVFDKTETPSSWLVLTTDEVVPAFAVKLKSRLSRAECQRMYEERFGSEEEDEGEDGGYY